MNPVNIWKTLDKSDRYMLVSSIFVPLVVWWFYIGRTKYGTKGMR